MAYWILAISNYNKWIIVDFAITIIRAHQNAAGSLKNIKTNMQEQGLGRSKG